ncbi:MAG: hypothetical protein CSB24_07085 [Deltaproteobacteria bacterium]|nr:MAG: hypothetical protein CSB24_07085 [Deltaproteobacteria bacterium]
MNEHIAQLVALQEIDQEIDLLDKKIMGEQQQLDERISQLAEKEALINELQEKIAGLEKDRRTLDDEMNDELVRGKERQAKMMQVQTSREQTALLKEIEDARKNVKEHEEQIITVLEEIEALTAQTEEESKSFKAEKKLLAEETEKVGSSIEGINQGKKEKLNVREERAKDIQPDLLNKYNTLRKLRNGLAVVNVIQGVCQGCFMSIPPQRFNMLLRGDQMFDCPTCQRIMYHQAPEED